ncbi:MAG: PASTA domain-containing protein [Bacteroidia bacterium]
MLKYFWSKEFFYSLLGLIVFGFLAYLLIFFVILPSYTRHGESVLVPDVGNLPEMEALEVLNEADLRYEIKDSVYEPGYDTRVILDQYPAPLSRVKPDRKIFLTITKLEAPMVQVPNMKEKQFIRAKEMLRSRKLIMGEKILRPDPGAFNNQVDGMMYAGKPIAAGEKVPQGSIIDLIILQSTNKEKVNLPNLVGLPLEDAISALRAIDLSLGATIYMEGGAVDQQGLIHRQNPPFVFERKIRVGSPVDIYIYGSEPE